MGWLKRHKTQVTQRTPDPDPVIEAHFKKLDELSHQNAIKRHQIQSYREEIQLLFAQRRDFAHKAANSHYSDDEARYKAQIKSADARILQLQDEIRQLEQDITDNHDHIISQTHKLEQTRYDINRFSPPPSE